MFFLICLKKNNNLFSCLKDGAPFKLMKPQVRMNDPCEDKSPEFGRQNKMIMQMTS